MTDKKKTTPDAKPDASRNPAGGGSDRDVGHALRSIYSSTVNEDIPAELLEMLGKLS